MLVFRLREQLGKKQRHFYGFTMIKNIPKIGGVNMSRVCNICGKGQASGNNVSHSNRKTRRTFKVNVQKISYIEDDKEINAYVCARCVRTLKKADAE